MGMPDVHDPAFIHLIERRSRIISNHVSWSSLQIFPFRVAKFHGSTRVPDSLTLIKHHKSMFGDLFFCVLGYVV